MALSQQAGAQPWFGASQLSVLVCRMQAVSEAGGQEKSPPYNTLPL